VLVLMKPRHWPGVTVKNSSLLAGTKLSLLAVADTAVVPNVAHIGNVDTPRT
jgi:hypothetical protein